MREIELIDKRGLREKHFLQENGEFRAEIYDDNIHYKSNGIFKEIDNSLILDGSHYVNKANENKISFAAIPQSELMRIEKDNHFLSFSLEETNEYDIKKDESMSKLVSKIKYINVLKNIDISYDLVSSNVKENIYIKNKDSDIDKLEFIIDTDMDLHLIDDKICSMDGDKCIFKFETPYMIDSSGNINKNVKYLLSKLDDKYILTMILDEEWLQSIASYPVVIDPTITDYHNDKSVEDTFISSDSSIPQGDKTYLLLGTDKQNVKHRILLKFNLPKIGTGSQVVGAYVDLKGEPFEKKSDDIYPVVAHRITDSWSEKDATWENMKNKYDKKVEAIEEFFYYNMYKNDALYTELSLNITSLVKKWYTDLPNHGLMIKFSDEKYTNGIVPIYYSKELSSSINISAPKPLLVIVYRNQNGLEKYLDYRKQSLKIGEVYQNTYNGNMAVKLDIASTEASKFPAVLSWFYNTNDVLLNNDLGVGLGGKFNYYQTIEPASEIKDEEIKYLKYTDEDGTIHYFPNCKWIQSDNYLGAEKKEVADNEYYDEDGLDMHIIVEDDKYILNDKNGNRMIFSIRNGKGYLSEIIDVSNNSICIFYDQSNRIVKICDSDNNTINISYMTNKVEVSYKEEKAVFNFQNNKICSLETKKGTMYFKINDYNLVESIVDINKIGYSYDYYNVIPYRIKKVVEYGIDKTVGASYELTYSFNSTTIVDNKGRALTIAYDNSGCPISITNLKGRDCLKDSYGIKKIYDSNFNRLIGNQTPLKYTRNFLSNSCFEKGTCDFILSGDSINMQITDEISYIGKHCLKICNENGALGGPTRNISLKNGKYYTFSAYVKAFNKSLSMKLSYIDSNNDLKEETCLIDPTNLSNNDLDFERFEVTIFYPETAISDLTISFEGGNIYYIDAIQLEEGQIANQYNILSNAGFENGLDDWSYEAIYLEDGSKDITKDVFEVCSTSDETKYVKMKLCPEIFSSISQMFDVKGKENEIFTLSFWYKADTIKGTSVSGIHAGVTNSVFIGFAPSDPEYGTDFFPNIPLESTNGEWQFVSYSFSAVYDFKSINVGFMQQLNANEFCVSNLCLYREVSDVAYKYDDNGNIIEIKKTDNSVNTYKYDENNKLIKMTNTVGKNLVKEYDKYNSSISIRGVTDLGISNEIIRDSNDLPCFTRVINRGAKKDILSGLYQIRLKGTSDYVCFSNDKLGLKSSSHYYNFWKFDNVIIDEKNYYKISNSIINEKYISVIDNKAVLSNYSESESLFELEKTDCDSFKLKNKKTGKYITINDSKIVVSNIENNNNDSEFYIEKVDKIFIENGAKYSQDGKYITKMFDTNFHTVSYDIDEDTGVLKSITSAKNVKTYFNYNEKYQVESMTCGSDLVRYEYNEFDLIDKIIQDGREYKFEYDNFLNISSIKINNKILISNEYEINHGMLNSVMFGNNNDIKYIYDEFDRLKKAIKMDDEFEMFYNNNGQLAKVKSNSDIFKYVYDSANRLYEYWVNNFRIRYNYDSDDNIVKKQYKLDNTNHTVENVLDANESVVETKFDDFSILYNYDSIGRLVDYSINNSNSTYYKYVSHGNRTSNIIKEIIDGSNKYSYKYDKANNITHIYYNNRLIVKYYYDKKNQLVREDDYKSKKTTRYYYDYLYNITSKKEFEINTYNQLSQTLYKYNSEWKDQLISCNEDKIEYDEIGNPIKIGNASLKWVNGKQLKEYSKPSLDITYKYNNEGIRIGKTVNGINHEYYLERNHIIFEKINEKIIYYLRNDLGSPIGFIYDGKTYFYKKNINNDIIGISDEKNLIIATYEYDSWGNIISIRDNNNIDISKNESHIGNINPFRYRSYYFDSESNLYYLNKRYYNPLWGRFLNMDDVLCSNQDFASFNPYVYCGNNPVNFTDENGYGFFKSLLKKALNVVVEKAVEIVTYISKKCNVVQTKGSVTTKQKIVDYSKSSLVHYEAGSMQTVSKSISTSSSGGFVIQSDIENFESGSISLSSNNKNFNAALNIQNITNFQLSLSLNIGKKEITFSTGVENGWLTLMSSTQKDVGGGVMEGYYDKVSFSPLSLAFAVVTVSVCAGAPAIIPVATAIGSNVKEAAIGISIIGSSLGRLLSFAF